MRASALAVAIISLAVAGTAPAADFSDPTWPCVQRKVEQLSPGLMWPHPIEEAAGLDDTLKRDIRTLSETLALRRVALEDATPQVEAFAETYQGDPTHLGRVFIAVFDRLSSRRTRIINGIGTFSLGQIELAAKIDETRAEMEQLMAADSPDFDKVDALEEQLDWDQVIYSDRQRSITYLCETPVLLERRLFSVAQMLQAVAQQ